MCVCVCVCVCVCLGTDPHCSISNVKENIEGELVFVDWMTGKDARWGEKNRDRKEIKLRSFLRQSLLRERLKIDKQKKRLSSLLLALSIYIGLVGKAFANAPGDLVSIPGCSIPKTLKWY